MNALKAIGQVEIKALTFLFEKGKEAYSADVARHIADSSSDEGAVLNRLERAGLVKNTVEQTPVLDEKGLPTKHFRIIHYSVITEKGKQYMKDKVLVLA